MPRYMETAKRYEDLPQELLDLIPEEHHEVAYDKIARLVNAGMVGNPRPAQGTVRLNYVKAVCRHLPLRIWLEEREIKGSDRTYKALCTEPR